MIFLYFFFNLAKIQKEKEADTHIKSQQRHWCCRHRCNPGVIYQRNKLCQEPFIWSKVFIVSFVYLLIIGLLIYLSPASFQSINVTLNISQYLFPYCIVCVYFAAYYCWGNNAFCGILWFIFVISLHCCSCNYCIIGLCCVSKYLFMHYSFRKLLLSKDEFCLQKYMSYDSHWTIARTFALNHWQQEEKFREGCQCPQCIGKKQYWNSNCMELHHWNEDKDATAFQLSSEFIVYMGEIAKTQAWTCSHHRIQTRKDDMVSFHGMILHGDLSPYDIVNDTYRRDINNYNDINGNARPWLMTAKLERYRKYEMVNNRK